MEHLLFVMILTMIIFSWMTMTYMSYKQNKKGESYDNFRTIRTNANIME